MYVYYCLGEFTVVNTVYISLPCAVNNVNKQVYKVTKHVIYSICPLLGKV